MAAAHGIRNCAGFRGLLAALQMRHGYDAVGVHLATLVDREIFVGHETLICEVKPDLVRRIGVVERPAAATMKEMTVLVFLVRPQSRDPACLAMLSPQLRVDAVVGIERRNDDIGVTGVAFGVASFACKLDADLPKLRRKACIQDRLGMGTLYIGIAPWFAGWPVLRTRDYFGCAAAVAAAGFFRLLMMIVISGTIIRGRIPFRG